MSPLVARYNAMPRVLRWALWAGLAVMILIIGIGLFLAGSAL